MKKYINYILSIMILASMTSCFKSFDEIRQNPNNPSQVDPEALFANALYANTGGAYGTQGQYYNLTGAGLWAQHFAKIQYLDEDWYEYRPGVMDEKWKMMYSGSSSSNLAGIYDLELALKAVRERKLFYEERGEINEVKNAQALEGAIIASKVYFFSATTDVWGDIPYSEAFQTEELGYDQTNFQPVYDRQQDIYNDLFELLDYANELLAEGGSIDTGSDLIYRGNTSKWQKFTNSLAARLYTRINKVDGATSKQGLDKLFSNPAKYPMFFDNSDDAELIYAGSQPYMQPIYYNYHIDRRDDFAISKNTVDLLKETNDKRLYIFAQPTPTSMGEDSEGPEYVGQENGVPRAESPAINSISRIGNLYREQPAGKSFWMTYSELKFIEAEALLNNVAGVSGSVRGLVEEGIKASFKKQYDDVAAYQAPMIPVEGDEILGAADDADEVIANLNWDKNGGEFRIIMEQKYLSIFTNGPEAFAELRRTGWPAIDEVRGASQYTEGLPNRFPYPFSEQTSNASNWSKASEGIINTVYGKKVWFAENTEINYK